MRNPRLEIFRQTGLMGELIASFNWTSTSVGDPSHWPEVLFNSIDMILGNKFPMCILWGRDACMIYNDGYGKILGYRHPEALGKNAVKVWEEVAAEPQRIVEAIYSGGTVYEENKPYFLHIEGKKEERFYTFSCGPIHQNKTEIVGAMLTIIDTTDEFLWKRKLKESETNFRNYQELSPLPFLSLTEDWVVSYANPSGLEAIVGIENENIIGRNFFDLWPSTKGTIFEKNYQRAMKGEVVMFESAYEPIGHWYRIVAFPLNPGVGVFYQDITEPKRLHLELQKAVESRDRFLSIASHELNTPLTSLKLHTQMMERMVPKGVSPERLMKFFEQTDLQLQRLGHLVGDMLDASRIREGKLSLNLERSDLKKVVIDALERFAPYFHSSGMRSPELTVNGNNFQCPLDAGRFDQVVSNLLTNAVKYGEGKPVEVSLTEEQGQLILKVSDHGPGIPEEDIAQIFDQYKRGKNVHVEGLGLGLFIARQIVLAHGGEISVESPKGLGCTFSVRFPQQKLSR